MTDTTRRIFWNGSRVHLQTLWTLSKRGTTVRCELWTHALGWELRIDEGGILMSQVCRSRDYCEERQLKALRSLR